MTIKVTSVTAAADYGKMGLCNFGADPSVTPNTRFACFYAMNVGTDRYIELRVRGSDGASPSSPGGSILVTYCIAQAAMLVLAYTLYRIEITGKRLDLRLRELREVLA